MVKLINYLSIRIKMKDFIFSHTLYFLINYLSEHNNAIGRNNMNLLNIYAGASKFSFSWKCLLGELKKNQNHSDLPWALWVCKIRKL